MPPRSNHSEYEACEHPSANRVGNAPRVERYGRLFRLRHAGKKTVEDFNNFGRLLKENGLIFCYHNHGFEFIPYGNGTYFDYIVQNTNPDYVSFEMDILWVFHPGQYPTKLLKKYPERFRLMHVKDLKKGVPHDFTGQTPPENDITLGMGQLDLPSILKEAKKTRIKYYYIEDENPEAVKQVPLSLIYLKGL